MSFDFGDCFSCLFSKSFFYYINSSYIDSSFVVGKIYYSNDRGDKYEFIDSDTVDHSSSRVTEEVYSHILPTKKDEVASAFDYGIDKLKHDKK